ncbi:TetR/AcrR family transcriptional regulator [Puteibacter caeruleilacunae]|nr:TetR/AcrR family transcriptional regulator [Puteibacter caeruleilacunae]
MVKNMAKDNKSVETQQQILDAARRIFSQKGLAGARMQEIADEAGINKALLHYYYRNKNLLFEQVLEEAVRKLFKPLAVFLMEDSDLFDKIRNLCHLYYSVLMKYPFIPNFVTNEASMDRERVFKLIKLDGIIDGKNKTVKQIEQYIEDGKIRPVDPRDLIWNIISLCVFPIISRPIAGRMLYQSEEEMEAALKSRADHVADFIIAAIKV